MLEKHLSFPDRPISLLADDELVQRPSHCGSAPVDHETRPFLHYAGVFHGSSKMMRAASRFPLIGMDHLVEVEKNAGQYTGEQSWLSARGNLPGWERGRARITWGSPAAGSNTRLAIEKTETAAQ